MITKLIDLKHHIAIALEADGEYKIQIVKTGNGVPIPDDEPVILFRGRDHLAVPLLEAYLKLCVEDECNEFQLGSVGELLRRFRQFRDTHPQVMKQPGVTRGL